MKKLTGPDIMAILKQCGLDDSRAYQKYNIDWVTDEHDQVIFFQPDEVLEGARD